MSFKNILILMLPAFVECMVLVGIHSYLGIHVIKRKVIFVDLALAQIAALGTLLAFLFGIAPHTPGAYIFSVGLTAAAAAVFALCRFREGKIPQEAIIGLVYAIAAATSILMIDKAPHGAEHIKEILTGSILWVKWPTIAVAAGVYTLVGGFHYFFRHRFLLISNDPEAAWNAGVNVRLWDFLFYLSFGIVITLSVDTAGVLIVFVFLVAPAIVAMSMTDRLPLQLAIGWGLGLAVTTAGLVLSYVADLPAGSAVIGSYGAVILLISVVLYNVRAENFLRSLKNTALAAAGFTLFFGLLFVVGRSWPAGHGEHSHPPHPAGGIEPEDDLDSRIDEAQGFESIEKLYKETTDPEARLRLVIKALDEDRKEGIKISLQYLSSGPPPFFVQEVVEKLENLAEQPLGFDAMDSMDSEGNRKALERAGKLLQQK